MLFTVVVSFVLLGLFIAILVNRFSEAKHALRNEKTLVRASRRSGSMVGAGHDTHPLLCELQITWTQLREWLLPGIGVWLSLRLRRSR